MNVGETFAMVRMSVEERGFRESVRIPHSRLRRGEAGSGNEARITVLPKKGREGGTNRIITVHGRRAAMRMADSTKFGGQWVAIALPSVRPRGVRIRRQSE